MTNKPISEVIDDLKEVNCLLRDKVKCLESDLWDANQLRKVHSEKSFELEGKVRELERRNNKDFAWRAQEIGRLDDELDIARERISSLEQQLAAERDSQKLQYIRRIESELAAERARVVKAPKKVNVKMGGDKSTKAMFSGMNMMHDDFMKALADAGIPVEGE